VRIAPGLSGIGGHVGGLVHPSVARDPRLRSQHQWFIGTRLAIGCVGLAAVPVALAVNGGLNGPTLVAVLALVVQAGLAVWTTRTGDLNRPLALSSLSLTLGLLWVGAHDQGLTTQLLNFLPILVVEAAILGRRRALALSVAFAAVALVILAVAGPAGLLAGGPATSALVQQLMLVAAAVGIGLYGIREAELRESRDEQLAVQRHLVIAGFGDLVTHHDEQGGVVSAGDSALTVIGAPPSSLLGRGLFERVHVADRPAFLNAIAHAASGDGLSQLELRIRVGGYDDRLQPPTFSWFELRARAIPATADVRGHVLCMIRDISAQHERADALEKSRREADLANALKSRFLAMVSHELRTPLNAIIGFSEILANDGLVPTDAARRREYATIVNNSGQHLLGVVNTLLDISQIEAGTFPLDPEPVAFGEVLAGVVDMIRLKAGEAEVRIEVTVAADLPTIVADRRACRQILLNLLSNAVKFTPKGGDVSVRLERQFDGLVIRVADTGIGIPSDDLPRLGEPFFQVRSGNDRPFEGTGLGLSVVRGLVGLHGGTLTIDSAPGKGTTVAVRLPASVPKTRAGQAPVVIAQAFGQPAPSGGSDQASLHPDTARVKKRA
jgi:cell cycle sensor histidine kinase DivJ